MGGRKEDDYYEDSSDSSSSVEHKVDRDDEEGSSDEDDDFRNSEDEDSDDSTGNLPNRKRKLSDEWTVEEKLALRRDHGMTALLPKSSTRSRHEVNEAKKEALKVTKERLEEQSRLIRSGVGDSDKSEDKAKRKKKKRKHAPTEASSKKSDFARRKHFGGAGLDTKAMGIQHLYKARDPRISDRITSKSSIYKADRDYAFLQEKVDDEIKELKQRIKAWNATGTKGQRTRRKLGMNGANMSQGLLEDKEKLQRLTQQSSERMRAQAKRQAHYQWKQDAATRQAEGKPIYYPKRREIKQQLMEAKFDELRKRGGDKAVEKAMAKRRKKNAQKDRRRVPNLGDSRTLVPTSRRN